MVSSAFKLSLSLCRSSILWTVLRFLGLLAAGLSAPLGTLAADGPRCEQVFRSSSLRFVSEIEGRAAPEFYLNALAKAETLLSLMEPLPEGYTVVLKHHYGQGSLNNYREKRIEFTEVHTTYQKYTGKEDLSLILPVLVHEYSHAFFESTMRKLSPRWEEDSRTLYAPFGNTSTGGPLAMKLSVYHEFFADLVPALLYEDPAVMAKALQLHEGATESLRLRNFTGYEPLRQAGDLQKILESGGKAMPYVYLTPLRNEFWALIAPRLQKHPEEKPKILRRVAEVLAQDYELRSRSQDFSFKKMNQDLMAKLQAACAPVGVP